MPISTSFTWSKIPFFRKVDRYIFVEFISPFLGGIVFFTFIFLMFQALRLAELLVVRGVPAGIVGKMVVYNVMQFLPFTIPVAFLMGTLITFGRLSNDSELVAMKATGMSLPRLSLPIFMSAGFVAVISLLLNLNWVPQGNRQLKSLLVKAGNTKIASALQEGTFTSGFYDLLIYAGKLDSKTSRMKNVFIYDERKPDFPFVMIAKEGEILKVESEQELGSEIAMRLYDGSIHRIDQGEMKTAKHQRFDFLQEISYLQIIEGRDNSRKKPKSLTYPQLQKRIASPKTSQKRKTVFKTELYNRVAQAISTFFFALLGVGFGTSRTRGTRSSAVLVTLITIVVFYGLRVWGTQLAHQGTLPPLLATHLPNLAFLGLGLWAFKRASW